MDLITLADYYLRGSYEIDSGRADVQPPGDVAANRETDRENDPTNKAGYEVG